MLKSVNGLKEMIIKGQIKRIFIFDSWNKHCIIFNETVLNDCREVNNYILQQANINNALIKVFTKDMVDNYYKGVETIDLPKGECIKTDKSKVTVKIKLEIVI